MFDVPTKLRRRVSFVGVLVSLYMLGIVTTAWTRLDVAWDSLAYHLPFAAIRAGLVTYSDHIISSHHRIFLEGFPPVVDFIKGMMWRVTGRVEATQLFNSFVVISGSAILAKLYGHRISLLILAVLAIPVAQLEFAGNYTDLPVNFLLASALFAVAHSLASPEAHKLRHGVVAASALCLATTFKVTAIPFGIVIWTCYVIAAGFGNQKSGVSALARLRARSMPRFLLFVAVGALAAIGYGLVNLVVMGNPLWPVPIQFGPLSFPGAVAVSNWSAAAYLADVPRTFRWLVSVMEWHAFDLRPLPYIIAQGDVPESAMSYRMGGLFAYQVMLTVAILFLTRISAGTSATFKVLGLHIVMALVVSLVPGSHEMRYFFFWYLSLLWSALHLLAKVDSQKQLSAIFAASLAASALYITMITGARYVYPFTDAPSAEDLARGGIRAEVRRHLSAGQRSFCVLDKDPYGFLYSRPFHETLSPGLHYQTSVDANSSVCQSSRTIGR